MGYRGKTYLFVIGVVILAVVSIVEYVMADSYSRHSAVSGRCAQSVPTYGGQSNNYCNSAIFDTMTVSDGYGGTRQISQYRRLPTPYSLCNEGGFPNGPGSSSVTINGAGVSCTDAPPTSSAVDGSSGYMDPNGSFHRDWPCTIDIQAQCCRPSPLQTQNADLPQTAGRCAFGVAVFDSYANGVQIFRDVNVCSPVGGFGYNTSGYNYLYTNNSCPSGFARTGWQSLRETRIIDTQTQSAIPCTLREPNAGGDFVGANGQTYPSMPCTINAGISCTEVRDPYSCD